MLRWFEFNLLFCLHNCLLFVQSPFLFCSPILSLPSRFLYFLARLLFVRLSVTTMSPSPVFIAKFFALICANLISCVISFLCSQLTAALAALKLRRAPTHPPSSAYCLSATSFPCISVPTSGIRLLFALRRTLSTIPRTTLKICCCCEKKDTLSEREDAQGVSGKARLADTNSASL